MKFDIITIFPKIYDSYFSESILGRAQKQEAIKIKTHDLRNFSGNKHRKVDDTPYGGGAGMVFKIEPVVRAIGSILKNSKSQIPNSKQIPKSKSQKVKMKIVLTSARGKQFTQGMAREWAKKYDDLIIIAGHYEGVDERVKSVLRHSAKRQGQSVSVEEISVGPYILTGGELPAMIMIDAVSRHIPGVLGKQESLEEIKGSYPVFTRPEVFEWPPRRRGRQEKKYRVPKVLLGGNHKKIAAWRSKN